MAAGNKDTLANIFGEINIVLGPELWSEGLRVMATLLDETIDLAHRPELALAV